MSILIFLYLLLITIIAILSLIMTFTNRHDIESLKEDVKKQERMIEVLKVSSTDVIADLYFKMKGDKSDKKDNNDEKSDKSDNNDEKGDKSDKKEKEKEAITSLKNKIYQQRLSLGLQPYSLLRSLDDTNVLFNEIESHNINPSSTSSPSTPSPSTLSTPAPLSPSPIDVIKKEIIVDNDNDSENEDEDEDEDDDEDEDEDEDDDKDEENEENKEENQYLFFETKEKSKSVGWAWLYYEKENKKLTIQVLHNVKKCTHVTLSSLIDKEKIDYFLEEDDLNNDDDVDDDNNIDDDKERKELTYNNHQKKKYINNRSYILEKSMTSYLKQNSLQMIIHSLTYPEGELITFF